MDCYAELGCSSNVSQVCLLPIHPTSAKVNVCCTKRDKCAPDWVGVIEIDLKMIWIWKLTTYNCHLLFFYCLTHFSRSIICHFPKQKTTNILIAFFFVALQVLVLVHRVDDKPQTFYWAGWSHLSTVLNFTQTQVIGCKDIIVSCTSCSNLNQLKYNYTILCLIRLSSSFFRLKLFPWLCILRSLLSPVEDSGQIRGLLNSRSADTFKFIKLLFRNFALP